MHHFIQKEHVPIQSKSPSIWAFKIMIPRPNMLAHREAKAQAAAGSVSEVVSLCVSKIWNAQFQKCIYLLRIQDIDLFRRKQNT